MNEILFLIGDWPVRTVDALISFGALALILLLTIAIVIARSGRRGAELAMAQVIRADELEERLSEILCAQNEHMMSAILLFIASGPLVFTNQILVILINRATRDYANLFVVSHYQAI